MYLTITSTARPATDLGYLLHKHPARPQSLDLPYGTAHVFYPEATDERCTVALLLEVDPIRLVRGKGRGADGFALAQYVNDRPYAASSMLAVALGRAFRTAMAGRCEARPDLPEHPLPLEIRIPALPTGGTPGLVERFFEPLGWAVRAPAVPLDPVLGWGPSGYADTVLTGTLRLADALSQLYVLLPALDGAKHYWVGETEVEKLVRIGGAWFRGHPERELIATRYLARRRDLARDALDRLGDLDETAYPDAVLDTGTPQAAAGQSLAQQRRAAVVGALRAAGAARVVDMGCGEGALLADLIGDPAFTECVGVDVSPRALERAERRLELARMPQRQRNRLKLLQSSVTYRDARLAGYDAMVLMEVIEHLDLDRLPTLVRTVFGAAAPGCVIVTTPNADFNPLYPGLAPGAVRHRDHRFEFSRAEFAAWARDVAGRFGYHAELGGIGPQDAALGPATQLAVFTRRAAA